MQVGADLPFTAVSLEMFISTVSPDVGVDMHGPYDRAS